MTILIGEVRAFRGMTLTQLSKKTGISRSTLHDYEAGKRSPRMDKLIKIAIALHCGVNDLFEADEQIND